MTPVATWQRHHSAARDKATTGLERHRAAKAVATWQRSMKGNIINMLVRSSLLACWGAARQAGGAGTGELPRGNRDLAGNPRAACFAEGEGR